MERFGAFMWFYSHFKNQQLSTLQKDLVKLVKLVFLWAEYSGTQP